MSSPASVDPMLLRILESEVSEGAQAAQSHLLDLESGAGDPTPLLEDILRIAHNLKGSANVAGLLDVGSFVHALEARLMTWREMDGVSEDEVDLALRCFDVLSDFTLQPDGADIVEQVRRLQAELGCEIPSCLPTAVAPKATEAKRSSPAPTNIKPSNTHRISRESVDEVRNTVSDVLAGMFEARAHLKGLERAMRHLTSVALPDSVDSQISEARSELRRALGDLRPVLHRLDQETRDLEDRSRKLCLVPVKPLVDHLQRVIRDTAKQLGRKVRLEVLGGELDMDIELVESLKGPLAHIVRNAVDHGIESADVRLAAGKPERGSIDLTLEQRGDRIIVRVQDDGAGVDVDAVRVRLGSMATGMKDHELCQAVLLAGFSTRAEVTELSGRGIGLGAVAQMTSEMRGHVDVASERGVGTTITVDLPLNMSIIRGLSVLVGDLHLVLPEGGLVGVGERGSDEVVDLTTLLGVPGDSTDDVVLLKGRDGEVPVSVTRVLGPVEVVRRDLGAHLGTVCFVEGAAILEHGQPALILNLHEVVSACEGTVRPSGRADSRNILVVDDSATLRARMRDALVEAGFHVVVAEDGEQALAQVERGDFDAIVSDVQMPNLDGLQLLERVGQRLPTILATSYPQPADEVHAKQLGARAYLLKNDKTSEVVIRLLHEILNTHPECSP